MHLQHYQVFAHVFNHSTYHRGQIVTYAKTGWLHGFKINRFINLFLEFKKLNMETIATKKEKATKKNEVKEPISISGSVAVMEALVAENVETIFGYPGGAIMPIYDALYDYQ